MEFLLFLPFITLFHSLDAQVDPYNTNNLNNDGFNGNQLYGNNYNQNTYNNQNPNFNNYNSNVNPNTNYNPNFNTNFNPNNANYNPVNINYNQNFGEHQGSYGYGNVEEFKCPEYWIHFQNSCYRFIKSPLKPYNDARRICQVSSM